MVPSRLVDEVAPQPLPRMLEAEPLEVPDPLLNSFDRATIKLLITCGADFWCLLVTSMESAPKDEDGACSDFQHSLLTSFEREAFLRIADLLASIKLIANCEEQGFKSRVISCQHMLQILIFFLTPFFLDTHALQDPVMKADLVNSPQRQRRSLLQMIKTRILQRNVLGFNVQFRTGRNWGLGGEIQL